MACAVLHPDTGKAMEYIDLMNIPALKPLWRRGLVNEYGRLFQGIRDIKGTTTCFSWNCKIFQRTTESLMAKLYAIKSRTKSKRNV
jgi:hypothetical protein